MKNVKCLLLSTVLLVGSINAYADVSPACPTPDEVKQNLINTASQQGRIWVASSPNFGSGVFKNVSISMYENGLDESSAMALAKKNTTINNNCC